MEIGNTVEISDQNFYLGIVFFRSGDELPDPKFRLMTHIRRYGGLEINFKNILFLKKSKFLSKNNYVPHGNEIIFHDHVAHKYFSIKISFFSKLFLFFEIHFQTPISTNMGPEPGFGVE